MNDANTENVVGALALALSDGVLVAAQSRAPANVSAAGLALVGHAPGITIHELSRALGLSHPGAVRLVDRMAADGLVERRRSETDGRAVTLHLTPAGTETERGVLASRRELLRDALSTLDAADRDAFGRIAAAVLAAMVRDPDHAARVCRLCDAGACDRCPVETELVGRAGASGTMR